MIYIFLTLLSIYFPPCLGRRYFTSSNNSSQSQTTWFFSFQENFDTRSVSKIILSILIIILLLIVSYLIVKIARHCYKRRNSAPLLSPIPSPIYSISSDPKITINNINVIINSCHCSKHVKENNEEGGRESEEQILRVVKEHLGYQFG